jgi:ABC-2 type transport system ATP-binding protein
MLEVSNLTKSYGSTEVLHGISFTALHGSVLGILGPNGAGKSTTMNTITGLMAKSGGSIRVCGIDTDSGEDYKRHIGYLPEATPLAVNMTVDEFLEFSSDLKFVPKPQKKHGIEKAEELTGISAVRRRLIRNLSKGYRQRVGIAQALIGFPEVLILDEPTSGLDPAQLIEIRQLVRDLGREHTVLFSSHILREVESVCDQVVILYKGRILVDGKPQELVAGRNAGSGYKLTAKATEAEISAALAAAGIEVTEIAPLSAPLEEIFVRLIANAEMEPETETEMEAEPAKEDHR